MRIIVIDNETKEVVLFNSCSSAAAYIEPCDTALYSIYDEEGFEYRSKIIKTGFLDPDKVLLQKTSTLTLEHLRELISSHLGRLGDPSKYTLDEMLALIPFEK